MDRMPNAADLTQGEMASLRRIVLASFTPGNQLNALHAARLLELGAIRRAMGGVMPTPAGRIISRLR